MIGFHLRSEVPWPGCVISSWFGVSSVVGPDVGASALVPLSTRSAPSPPVLSSGARRIMSLLHTPRALRFWVGQNWCGLPSSAVGSPVTELMQPGAHFCFGGFSF